MGSARVQGELWGALAQDWAFKAEPASKPFWEAILDATHVGPQTCLLDLGCGGGGLCVLAAERGAEIHGVDASEELIAIAKSRVPAGQFLVGDIESAPFPDDWFNLVVACNSIQFADNPKTALEDVNMLLTDNGKFVIGMWCEMERTDMKFIFEAVGKVAPPPPPNSKSQPSLAIRENLIALVESAKFKVVEEHEVATPFVYPNAEEAWTAFRSAGLIVGVMRAIGEDNLRNAVFPVIEKFRQPDGSIRLENCFRFLVCTV